MDGDPSEQPPAVLGRAGAGSSCAERHPRSTWTCAAIKPPAPDTLPILLCGNSFPLLRGVRSDPLRSRCSWMEDQVHGSGAPSRLEPSLASLSRPTGQRPVVASPLPHAIVI